jgi:hypothetical protein
MSTEQYNYEHFRIRHLLHDAMLTLTREGIAPGEVAPDFELPGVEVETVRLSNLRGRPVLLHFGSYS